MAARRKRKASTKIPFDVKQRKKMVEDLEEVQYDDVVQMAMQRLEAGRHLERYNCRREFVRTICRDPAAQALTACIMGIVLAFLDMYRSCMKGKKGARFANFQQKWFEHINDYVHVDEESESEGTILSDKTERRRLWKRVTAVASEAGFTLDAREERIIVSTLCYIVYDLMTDKMRMYKVAISSEVSCSAGAGASAGSSTGLEIQLRESDVNVYRYGGFALHSMLKKRTKTETKKLNDAKLLANNEIKLLENMRIKDERCTELPLPIQQLQKGGLHIMTPEMLPFLREVVERVASMVNDEMKKKHGRNMIAVAEKHLESDQTLQSLFQTCTSLISSNFSQTCLQTVCKELTKKIFHARVNEYMAATEEIELERKGKAVKAEQCLRDQLKTFSGLKER